MEEPRGALGAATWTEGGFGDLFADVTPPPWAGGQGWGCREFTVLAAPSSSHSSPAPGGDRCPNIPQVGLQFSTS